MLRYLSILGAIFKASLITDLSYRLNFFLKIFTDLIWYFTQISVFEVLFLHTKIIAGWNLQEMRIFLLVLFLVDALYMIFLHENMDTFSDRVRKGELDMILAKPIDSQFMISFSKMSTPYVFNVFMVAIVLAYFVHASHLPVTWLSVAAFLSMLIPASLIYYSVRFFLSSLAIIFEEATSVNYLWYQLYRFSYRPIEVYPRWMRMVTLTILPLGYLINAPAHILVKGFDASLFFGSFIFSGLIFMCSRMFWRYLLSRYSSASS